MVYSSKSKLRSICILLPILTVQMLIVILSISPDPLQIDLPLPRQLILDYPYSGGSSLAKERGEALLSPSVEPVSNVFYMYSASRGGSLKYIMDLKRHYGSAAGVNFISLPKTKQDLAKYTHLIRKNDILFFSISLVYRLHLRLSQGVGRRIRTTPHHHVPRSVLHHRKCAEPNPR